jgi:hypothetical protein
LQALGSALGSAAGLPGSARLASVLPQNPPFFLPSLALGARARILFPYELGGFLFWWSVVFGGGKEPSLFLPCFA